jgi:hypothetical protein
MPSKSARFFLEPFEVTTAFARRFNMRAINMFMLSTAASLVLATVAHAADTSRSAEKNAGKAVYEGLDAQGRIVRLTVSDARVETFERVSPPKVRHYPQPHWTSRIGTGTATEVGR